MKSNTSGESIDQEKLLGQIVANFANSQDPVKDCFDLFESAQKAFGFSPKFAEMAKDAFPTPEALEICAEMETEDLADTFFQRFMREKLHSDLNFDVKQFKKLLHTKTSSANFLKQLDYERTRLMKILDAIIRRENLTRNRYFREILNLHNNFISHLPKLDQLLSRKGLFTMGVNMKTCGYPHFVPNPRQPMIFAYPHTVLIAVSTIRFFSMNPRNERLMRKCSRCGAYFVASKDDKRFKKCPTCSPKSSMSREERNEYQKRYNAKKKQERESQELEVRIACLMEASDVSREEALEIIKADSMP